MKGGGTSLSQIEHSKAKHLISAHFGGTEVPDGLAADCELLRSCIWSLSNGTSPVHILRVLNLALSLWDEDQDVHQRRERLREALEELSETGDLVSLPEGRWLPAFTREVSLETNTDERLIVGGLPTGILPDELKRLITHHGPYRRVQGALLGEALDLPKESVASWAGALTESLEEWAGERLNVKLDRYNEPQEGSRIRVYAPELARERSTQAKRWFERPSSISGRFLAARERVFGAREYRIVELREGVIYLIGDTLAPGEARRLMYALDTAAGKPVEVRLGTKGGSLSVTLRSELPRSERRMFGSMGVLEVPESDYYPRTWWFEDRYREPVLSRLQSLRVRILDSSSRRELL